jgi:hypothetical protein
MLPAAVAMTAKVWVRAARVPAAVVMTAKVLIVVKTVVEGLPRR